MLAPRAGLMESGMQNQEKPQEAAASSTEVDTRRRAALARLGKAAYIAPATVALLSVEAHAASSPPP